MPLWSDIPRRLATICLGFPFVWTMLKQPTLAIIFFVGAHALSLWEYTLLEPVAASSGGLPPFAERLAYCIVSGMIVVTYTDEALFHFLLCAVAGIFVWRQRRHWILGLVLVTMPFRTWLSVSQDFASTISVLLVVWNCDTGALLAGRIATSLGLPRWKVPTWIHQISPAKSMEGFLGGILGGTWTAVSWIPALVHWLGRDAEQGSEESSWTATLFRWFAFETTPTFDSLWQPLSYRIGLGLTLSCLAIVGDLMESAIKRQAQSKDSGSFLPGHGGVLDRFDSSLLAVLFYQFVVRQYGESLVLLGSLSQGHADGDIHCLA